MKKYFPILLAKAGEVTALSHLGQNVKDEIAPIFEVLPDSYGRIESSFIANWIFDDNEIYLDFSLCDPINLRATTNLINNLSNAGVNVIPVLQQNSSAEYINSLQNLLLNQTINNVCIRFSNGNFIDINTQVANFINSLAINRNQITLLLDFGVVTNAIYNVVAASSINIITGITHKANFHEIIIASGSFIENLSILNPAGRVYHLERYEWSIWQILQQQHQLADHIKYGDYGTKYPIHSEVNFPGSCSIKYTSPTEFVVFRGELSQNHRDGNGQYITFAKALVRSADYSGADFSWGDGRIDFFANQVLTDPRKKTGNSTNWVEISQNHHITLLHSLL